MKKNNNYLERIPKHSKEIVWKRDEEYIVLQKQNKGFWNSLFQKILKKPETSLIHLDKKGSFIWENIDGKRSIYDIGQKLSEEFGDEVKPLYERLIFYINTLYRCKFIDI